jgi:hypothetical protein
VRRANETLLTRRILRPYVLLFNRMYLCT